MEEGALRQRLGAPEDVVDEGVEDADLWGVGVSEGFGRSKKKKLTVHASGKLFQFKTRKSTSRMRLVRPGPMRKCVITARQSTKVARWPAYATAAAPMGRNTGKMSESVPTAIVSSRSSY